MREVKKLLDHPFEVPQPIGPALILRTSHSGAAAGPEAQSPSHRRRRGSPACPHPARRPGKVQATFRVVSGHARLPSSGWAAGERPFATS